MGFFSPFISSFFGPTRSDQEVANFTCIAVFAPFLQAFFHV